MYLYVKFVALFVSHQFPHFLLPRIYRVQFKKLLHCGLAKCRVASKDVKHPFRPDDLACDDVVVEITELAELFSLFQLRLSLQGCAEKSGIFQSQRDRDLQLAGELDLPLVKRPRAGMVMIGKVADNLPFYDQREIKQGANPQHFDEFLVYSRVI